MGSGFGRMVCGAALSAALWTPVVAQEFDADLGAEPLSVSEQGQLVVRNGDTEFQCALETADGVVTLSDCMPTDAAEGVFAGVAPADWEAKIRDAVLDADCKLSTLSAVSDVIEDAALAEGVSPEDIEAKRAQVQTKVDEVIDRMLWEGKLTVRDGEFAIDACL